MCGACYQRHLRRTSPERERAARRRYYAANRTRIQERRKARYREHADELRARQRAYDDARREDKRAYNRAYQRENHEGRARYIRNWRLTRRYGITSDEYDEMFLAQQGLCAVCGKAEAARDRSGGVALLRVDHCHATGEVRGLLCHRCNTRLACVEDREWLESALAYLSRMH